MADDGLVVRHDLAALALVAAVARALMAARGDLMSQQMTLIPVSDEEFTYAAYQLAKLLNQLDEEEAAWAEARQAHKETKAALAKAIGEQRTTIRRRELEHTEGITQRQVDALLASTEEQGDG